MIASWEGPSVALKFTYPGEQVAGVADVGMTDGVSSVAGLRMVFPTSRASILAVLIDEYPAALEPEEITDRISHDEGPSTATVERHLPALAEETPLVERVAAGSGSARYRLQDSDAGDILRDFEAGLVTSLGDEPEERAAIEKFLQ